MSGRTEQVGPAHRRGKGVIRSIRIEKAKNGHTVSVSREGRDGSYIPGDKDMVYGQGQHEQMMTDIRKHLGLPSGAAKKAAPKGAPAAPMAGSGIAARMSKMG